MADRGDHPTRDDIAFVSGAFWAGDHHEALQWMRANAPVYWDGGIWGITRHADIKDLSRTPETFSSAGGIRPQYPALPMMIDMDDPDHLNRRKLVNRGFTPKRIRDSEPAVRQACDEIIDAICERGQADLVTEIAAPLPMIMIGDALGVRPEHRADLLRWSDDMLRGPGHLRPTGDPRAGEHRIRGVHLLRHRGHRRPQGVADRRSHERALPRRGRR